MNNDFFMRLKALSPVREATVYRILGRLGPIVFLLFFVERNKRTKFYLTVKA